ncbi:hypothetical protein AAG906_019462 [Vitis piasezkii]
MADFRKLMEIGAACMWDEKEGCVRRWSGFERHILPRGVQFHCVLEDCTTGGGGCCRHQLRPDHEQFAFTDDVVPPVRSIGASKVKLYDANPRTSGRCHYGTLTRHSRNLLSTIGGAFARSDRVHYSDSNFNVKTGSPFLINGYPFFAHKANPKQVPIDFVLFHPNQGVVDPDTNLHYDNMFADRRCLPPSFPRLQEASVRISKAVGLPRATRMRPGHN